MTPELPQTTEDEKSMREWVERCADPAQEMLELRDLQNAQIDSMQHVWDNPEDAHWDNVQ
jgi:hypothetical protein